ITQSIGAAHVRRAAVFCAVILALSVGTIQIARAVQQRRVSALFARYADAAQTPLIVAQSSPADGRTLFAASEWSQPLPPGTRPVEPRVRAWGLGGDQCGSDVVPVTVRYDGRRRDSDLSEVVRVHLPSGTSAPTTLMVVAYDWANDFIRFRGIEVPADRA